MTAPMIALRRVSKVNDSVHAVRDLSLEIERGELCCLLGPSGCGKTTTIKLVNRMIRLTSGEILVDGRNIEGVRPETLRRGMGYVIQSVGLFPHMTVLDNIRVVPGLLGWDKRRAETRALDLLRLFGLDPDGFRNKYPAELSGGQAQRVGVARALAADPDILLMDEPFGALDPISRDRLQTEFAKIQQELRKTIVFVTHDIDEAVRLGSRIALMNAGELVQHDAPEALLSRPASRFVTRFMGSDRALKRLSLLRVRERVHAAARLPVTAGREEARRLFEEAPELPSVWVVNGDGRVLGWLNRPARDEPARATGRAEAANGPERPKWRDRSGPPAAPGGPGFERPRRPEWPEWPEWKDAETIREAMTDVDPLQFPIAAEATLKQALDGFIRHGAAALPVVDGQGVLIGEIRLTDLLDRQG